MKVMAAAVLIALSGSSFCAGEVSPTDLPAAFDRASKTSKKAAETITLRPKSRRRAIFRIISWNIQTFGSGLNPNREAAYASLLDHMFSTRRSAKILAIQELAQDGGADKFSGLLPGGSDRWNQAFQDTSDAQDNGFYTQNQVEVHWEQFLFASQDSSGRWRPDRDAMQHPARVAHMRVGDFDFTLITLHLTFRGGETDATVAELRNVLDWLEAYFKDPENDPDVVITGDFNLPTAAGRTGSKPALEEIIAQYPVFGPAYDEKGRRVPSPTELFCLVDEPTSRASGQPARNYDHFILSGDTYHEEYVAGSAGRMPAEFIHSVERAHSVYVSDHYPISSGFIYKNVANDGSRIRLDQPGWVNSVPPKN